MNHTLRESNQAKKEYLQRYGRALREQQALEAEIEMLREQYALPPGVQYSDMPKSPNAAAGDLSEYFIKAEALIGKLSKKKAEGIRIMEQIIDAIDRMPDHQQGNEKLLLRYRYIRLMKWEEVAEAMGYSEDRIKHIHGDALINFKF